MSEILMKDRPLTDADVPKGVPRTSPSISADKEFSLTSGAKTLQLNRNTLRAAIEAGELPAKRNAKGHYVIQGAQLFQWNINREADEARRVADRPESIPRPSRDVPRASLRTGVSVDRPADVLGGSGTSLRTSFDEDDPRVQNLLLKQRNDTLKQRTRELEGERDDWKEQARKLQEQAAASTRLLTDERERHQQKEAETAAALEEANQPQPRSKRPLLAVALVVLIGAVAVAAYLYPDQLGELLARVGQVSAAPESAALTAEPVAPSPTPAAPDVTPR